MRAATGMRQYHGDRHDALATPISRTTEYTASVDASCGNRHAKFYLKLRAQPATLFARFQNNADASRIHALVPIVGLELHLCYRIERATLSPSRIYRPAKKAQHGYRPQQASYSRQNYPDILLLE